MKPYPILKSCLRSAPLAGLIIALATGVEAVTYYSQGNLAPNLTTSWNSNTGGGGSSPANFTSAADTFVIQNAHTMTNSASWTLAGTLQVNAGGTLDLLPAGSATRNVTIGVGLVNNGTIKATSTSNGTPGHQIAFSGSACTWTGSGDISVGKIVLTINSNATLDISGLTTGLKFRSAGTISSTINGTLVTGTQVINGNGNASHTFNLNAGATLDTAKTNGVNGTFTWAGALNLNSGANYTFSGSAAQVTGAQMPTTVSNLTVNNSSGVTLSAATTVNGTLALTAGALTTSGATKPTVAATGSVTGTGHVNGPLARVYDATVSKSFRVGKDGNVRPVTLNYTALTGTSTVTVEQLEAAMGGTLPANTAQYGTRYWAVSQTGGSGITFDLSLDGTGFSPAGTAVMLQEGSPDTSYGTSFASPDYSATGITSTGNFTLGDLTAGLDQLAFTTSAHTLTAGVTSGTITVQLQDSGSTPKNATGDISVNLSSTSPAGTFRNVADSTTITSVTILSGTDSVSFKYRDTEAPATPILTAAASGVASANQQQTVNVGAATQLVFTAQPADGNVNYTLTPVVVQIRDAYGNDVPQSGTAITLTLNNGGGAVLSGTNPQNTDGSGKATFNNLAVNASGNGMSLDAAGGSLTPATSSTFNISYRKIVKAKTPTPMNQTVSWTGGVLPGANDFAVINNSSVGTSPNHRTDFGTSTSWYGLIVSNWSANTGYTISNTANATLTLGTGGIVGTDVNHSLVLSNHFALAGAQTWQWGDVNSSVVTLNINGNVNNNGHLLTITGRQLVSVAGAISGSGGLTWAGNGRVTLLAGNNYTGPTTVSGGTLRVDGSLASSSAVTVSGGTLQGSGTVGGPIEVQAGGTLAPGSGGIGTLTAGNDVTLSGTVVSELNAATYDRLDATGSTITLGGTLSVTNIGGLTLVNGTVFDLFDGTLAGSFAAIDLPGDPSHWNTTQLGAGGEGTLIFNNNAPAARDLTNGVAAYGAAAISIVGKFATDADNDALTISAVSTPANGTANISGGTILYTNTSGTDDSFTYTVNDGFTSITATIAVQVYSPVGFNKLSGPNPTGNPGEYEFSYLGIPGQSYAIEETSSLTPPAWLPVVTNTAAGNGSLNFIITPANPSGFFRTRHVP